MQKLLILILFVAFLFSCEKRETKVPFIEGNCSFTSIVKRPQYVLSSDSEYVKSLDSIVIKGSINFCCHLDTVATKINDKEYFLMKLGIQKCDSFGYIRREADKILYLHPRFIHFDKDDHRAVEQLFLDFSKKEGQRVNFDGASFFRGENSILIKKIYYDLSLMDSIYNYEIGDSVSTISMHGYNMEGFSVGKRTGIQRITFYDYNETTHLSEHITFNRKCD